MKYSVTYFYVLYKKRFGRPLLQASEGHRCKISIPGHFLLLRPCAVLDLDKQGMFVFEMERSFSPIETIATIKNNSRPIFCTKRNYSL